MRGTLGLEERVPGMERIIPAHAGNTTAKSSTTLEDADHPRACGEHRYKEPSMQDFCGSSPRMRGTLLVLGHETLELRIIPAHAGNTQEQRRWISVMTDHPRACGEHGSFRVRRTSNSGSSPRMRGTPAYRESHNRTSRIIPAHAGNTRPPPGRTTAPPDHPRACGEHPAVAIAVPTMGGSSPRMRGTPGTTLVDGTYCRIIPAHAGNTSIIRTN